jgi:putative inorganic carbon (HCO3(-)) transporter
MPGRVRTGIALGALALAPAAYSFHLLSFLHAKELVYATALLLLAILSIWKGGRLRILAWVAALALWLALEVAMGATLGSAAMPALEKGARAGMMLMLFLLAHDAMPQEHAREWTRAALAAGGALVGVLGLAQYFGIAHALLPVFPGYDQRMYSVFGNQDLIGGYVALCLPAALALFFTRSLRPHLAGGISLLILSPVLLLSGSRSAWLAAVIGVGLFVVLHARGAERSARRLGVILGVAALAGVILSWPMWHTRVLGTFGERDTGGNLRMWFYAGSWDMLRAHPWLGVGLGNFGFSSPSHMGAVLRGPEGAGLAHNRLFVDHAHSDALEFLAETGIVGAGLLMLLLAATLRPVWTRAAAPEVAMLGAIGAFALLNPALASAPHALAGLLALAGVTRVNNSVALPRRGIAAGALVLAAAWGWLTFLPSAAVDAHERHARDGADAAALYREAAQLGMQANAPAVVFEDALGAAAAVLVTGRPLPSDAPPVEELIRRGARINDSGSFHALVAEVHRLRGEVPAQRESEIRMRERWPD